MNNIASACITNKTFDEVAIGESASLTRTLSKRDIQLFAIVTGDMNPAHLDEDYAKTDIFRHIVGHGMWTGSLFSTLMGMYLPGPGTIYLSQSLEFLKPVGLGETVKASVKVIEKIPGKNHLVLETRCTNAKGELVIDGKAKVLAPKERISWKTLPMPEVEFKTPNRDFEGWMLEKVKGQKPLKVAVVHPVDALSLGGAVAAAQAGVIEPILVGPQAKIEAVAKTLCLDLSPYKIVHTQHSHAAAAEAVRMAAAQEVEALMKGKLHTDELMEAVVDKSGGLRTGRRMSHVFALEVPSYPKPLFLSDAAINIAPNLMDKKDIVQNAVDMFCALGLGVPKVAILSAVETVNEKMPSTVDATALCKMAERGQIRGAVLDGPLAFDNAISREAANVKGLHSEVAGNADILIAPDIESGNMLYKQLRYFSGAQGAGIVLGAKVPIILTSRAGESNDRIASCVLAHLYARMKALVPAVV